MSINNSEFSHINSPLVVKAHKELDNYLIKELMEDGKYCVVYCTSNGLYFPNTEENFFDTVFKHNHFEWRKKEYDLPKAAINIYLRDIFKQWYINGLNKEIDNIDKIISFIRDIVKGREIITIGSSSGGYLAVLLGSILSASHVFSFSGQFNLFLACHEGDTLIMENKLTNNKYYDLLSFIVESKIPIFYYSSIDAVEDIEQRKLVENLPNVYSLVFHGNIHGVPFKKKVLQKLLKLDKEVLIKLHDSMPNQVINMPIFEIKFLGFMGFVTLYIVGIGKKLIKVFR